MAQIDIHESGRVTITDGDHRGVVDPHKIRVLDAITLDHPITVTQRQAIMDKWATVPVPSPDPVEPSPTNDELYDIAIRNQRVLKAVVLSINDGTLVPGANVSNAALKAIVKANM